MDYDKIYYESDENEIRELLLYRKVVKVEGDTLVLDNGTELTFEGNEGCICGAGCYSVTELNECDNVITNVEFVDCNCVKISFTLVIAIPHFNIELSKTFLHISYII